MSLSSSPATTILPIADGDRARKYYEESLGLEFRGKAADGNLIFGLEGSATLALLEDPAAKPSGHTAISFEVQDITAAIRDLGTRGVAFEDYDLPGLKTTDHVCVLGSEKAAWFSDPDGNILCLHENLSA
ncbi:VOC family protein [Paenarthrobacter sp. PH39-S1]|uniref:VOC family protein n=1 Tax=Paenarthrobacter sp. PH39-S1 TaxID=3046204 RepID=UPI0024B8F08F|nr:VOC family protein [Paenarthrobacter sp. PH39-S1]MDJ0355276.1 VOC family protein [Paenarthrobacter sp. PH39-S1]